MSENFINLDETTVHYVYENEFILGSGDENAEYENIVCADSSRAILVDGQYLVADNDTVFLQDNSNLTQYYINEVSNSNDDEEEPQTSSVVEETQYIQVVDDNINVAPQIFYYSNGNFDTQVLTLADELQDDGSLEGIQDVEGNIFPFRRVKLESQVLNDNEVVTKQEITSETSNDSTTYAVLDYFTPEPEIVDISKITGRNLITGQTVTLHSYMDRLKEKFNNGSYLKLNPPKEVPKPTLKKTELVDLLDTKISIGKTKSGKKIVGKIIHVGKKSISSSVEEPMIAEEKIVEESENSAKILIQRNPISEDSFEEISKTLGGVMEMESVRQKLENKNIVVKLVERRYNSETNGFSKNISYSYGYMELASDETADSTTEKWSFISDQANQDVLLGDHMYLKNDTPRSSVKFAITTSLTIAITYGKGGNKTIRVNLNPAPGNLCTICAQYCKTNLQLRQHMNNVHNTYGSHNVCEICDKIFASPTKLQEHKLTHVEEGKLFVCSECNKCFTSQLKLQKHLPSHNIYLRPLECSVCGVRCANESALKKHLMTHTGIKPYSCDICQKQFFTQYDVNFHRRIHFPDKYFVCNICLRTFSRHSNLMRHLEIHKGKGTSFKCDACNCSYNYMSSLTRHMVRNHINGGTERRLPNDN